MNIFILDYDPRIAASYHTDTHVNKMLLESTQILSTAWLLRGQHVLPRRKDGKSYKPTHQGHPCVRWVQKSDPAFIWTLQLAIALGEEFYYRFNRTHACDTAIRNWIDTISRSNTYYMEVQNKRVLPRTFANATNDKWRDCKDIVNAYRGYYIDEKIEPWSYDRSPHGMPYWARS